MSDPRRSEQPPLEPYRLDPERAAADPGVRAPAPAPVIDTRRYRWTIGAFGLALVIAFSVYMFTTRGIQTAGVPPGERLHLFVAPLVISTLTGDANVAPKCDPAHPNPRALNVCGRTPIVLGLFTAGSSACVKEVDTLQTVSQRFRGRGVVFAAVAVRSSRSRTAALARAHGWTIPVGYDADGAVGALYGVDACPMVELARRGGIVAARLIGEHWLAPAALAAQVPAVLARRR